MKRVKLMIATALIAATVFGIGSHVLATNTSNALTVASMCCWRP
jgi:hypothetical protein